MDGTEEHTNSPVYALTPFSKEILGMHTHANETGSQYNISVSFCNANNNTGFSTRKILPASLVSPYEILPAAERNAISEMHSLIHTIQHPPDVILLLL